MKKLFSAILALILVLGLCACGQEKKDDAVATDPVGSDPTEPVATVPTTEPTVPATQSAAAEDLSDVTFTVCGEEFHLGMKMSELLASGVFTDYEYYEDTLEPIASGGALVNLGTEKKCTLTIYLWNLSRDTISAEDATVVGISYSTEYWEDSAKAKVGDVCFRGVKLNSSIEAITEVFGKPNVHEDTFDGDEYRGGGWRGFDIGEEFRMYISIEHLKSLPEAESMIDFSLQFKPFTDSIP